MMARRISGSEGCGGGPLPSTFFPPPRSLQAPVLQVSEGNTGHQRVPVQACPGPALEVAEAEFLLQVLMCLLAGPARLDGGGLPPQRAPRRQGAEGVFLFPAVAPFAQQPDRLARQAGAVGVARAVGNAHPHGGETGTERPLGTTAWFKSSGLWRFWMGGSHAFVRMKLALFALQADAADRSR